jgi:hypothetical protein
MLNQLASVVLGTHHPVGHPAFHRDVEDFLFRTRCGSRSSSKKEFLPIVPGIRQIALFNASIRAFGNANAFCRHRGRGFHLEERGNYASLPK